MLYKNMKAMVCSCNWDTNFFDIVVGVFQGDILEPYLLLLYLDFIFQTLTDLIIEIVFILKKAKSRWYPTDIMTDASYTDDLVLLANIPAQAESLLHSLE